MSPDSAALADASPEGFRRDLGRTLTIVSAVMGGVALLAVAEALLLGRWEVGAFGVLGAAAVAVLSRRLWRRTGVLLSLSERLDEAERNRQALDHSTANTMIADSDLNIVYVMPALEKSLARSAAWWRSQPSNVDATKLVGRNIDVFHKMPDRIRAMLRSMTDVYVTRIAFDGRSFELRVTPLCDHAGANNGFVVEWVEKTQEIANARRIAEVIEAAGQGDFSKRLDESALPPESRDIAAGVNRICGIVDDFCGHLLERLTAFADGDLTRREGMEGAGRFGEICDALQTATERLGALVGQIKATGGELGSATRQIAESSGDLSSRAESQAASLEETAATMHEMASTVRSNAENAERSSATAREAAERAVAGRAIVADAVTAMDRIQDSAGRISEITALIDSIAFQTNLLALNASVEAARAGEAGKGFAVVASEVRLLAQRSAEAARDIKTLIAESGGHVGEGVKLVQRTGEALEGLAAGIAEVAGKVEEITAATREQTAGVEEISSTITQLDELTQQNAALAEESAGAARSLDGQAERLFDLVAAFRIDEGAARAMAQAAE